MMSLSLITSVQSSSLCSNTNNCDQECVLLDGIEKCGCNMGYELAEDNVTCSGKSESLNQYHNTVSTFT